MRFFPKPYFVPGTICFLLVLSWVREPLFFTDPRIWAEEGSVYLQSALDVGWYRSLWMPHQGYYSLFVNAVIGGGYAAVGLPKLAWVTTYVSFGMIMLTILAPLFLPSRFWESPGKKWILCTFALVIGSGEIWVNTINVQFYLCLFACWVWLSDLTSLKPTTQAWVALMLGIGALSGVTTMVLLPFFLFKYVTSPGRPVFLRQLVLILICGSFVQLGAFLTSSPHGTESRLSLDQLVHLPFGLRQNLAAAVPVAQPSLLLPLLVLFLGLAILQKNRPLLDFAPLVLSVYLNLLFVFLSLHMVGGVRYGYVSSVLLFLFLLQRWPQQTRSLNVLYTLSLALMFGLGFVQFFQTQFYYHPTWVRWSQQTKALDSSCGTEVEIFPQWGNGDWKIQIPPHSEARTKR